ncbi:MAG: hypothetical protein J0L87_02000 [Bacteroidetes bacterium]|nr:hypothetical protein [Bacteroidota bacterium]
MTTSRFYILFLSLTILGCQQNSNDKQKSADKQIQTSETVDKPTEKSETKFHCSRIIISLYDKTIPQSQSEQSYAPFSTELIYETEDPKVLDNFEQMTKQAKRTGYCCCPERNYTISFYDKTYNFQHYYVDTVEVKDKVRIYESSFQFSYIIDKIKWLSFLTELRKISFNEYFISDLKTARKVHTYTIENDLPIITSKRTSKEWMNFDGDFKVRVAVVGEKLDENKVYANIKKAYPKDSFKIETISKYQMCGSHEGNDCYEEIILQIFCNKDFYDKFKVYSPKSFYDKAIAEFYVLGTRENLNKIDKLAKKEE